MTTNWAPSKLIPANLLTEINAADAAAQAARTVPGMVRLQPGVWGLIRQFATQAWTQATGKPLPDIAGVDASLNSQATLLRIDLRIVVSIDHHAASVGTAVHDAVTTAVHAVTDTPTQVRVHIVEVELEPHRGRQPAS